VKYPGCGFENPAGMKFCGECGGALALKCRSCGFEQIAEPGKAYLTEHTARLVEGQFALHDLGKLTIKG
jgi:hypothetical protein